MQSRYRVLFAVVILVVVGVAAVGLYGWLGRSGAAAMADSQPITTLDPAVPESELKSALDQIQALRLPEAARKRLIVAYLESVVAPEPAPFAYWEPAAVREARERIRKYEVDEAARRQLRTAFGEGVSEDPQLAFLFRPYADRYPALGTTKQLELQKLSLAPDRTLLASNVSPIQAQLVMRSAQREMEADIQKLLSEQEWQEYRRKESPAARSLASGGFRFTQQEFDAVMPTLAATEGDVAVKRFDAASIASVKAILGEKRFLEYRKSQDPTFQMLTAIVSAHGKQGANVDAAYKAVYENQAASADQLRAGPVLSLDAYQQRQRLAADLRGQLESNIGADATEIFLRSMETNRGLVQARMF